MNKMILQTNLKGLNKGKNNSGFTIIETLVAIAILMIAITGPLVVSNKSLTAALYAKDQTRASYIAQHALEQLRNKKDNNIALGRNWLIGFAPPDCPIYLFPGFTCRYTLAHISSFEVRVNVTVEWKEGNISNQVELVGNLTNEVL